MTKQRHPTYTNRVDMLMHLCVYIACKYTHIHATHIYCAWACRMHVCVYMFVVVVEGRKFTLNQNTV